MKGGCGTVRAINTVQKILITHAVTSTTNLNL